MGLLTRGPEPLQPQGRRGTDGPLLGTRTGSKKLEGCPIGLWIGNTAAPSAVAKARGLWMVLGGRIIEVCVDDPRLLNARWFVHFFLEWRAAQF